MSIYFEWFYTENILSNPKRFSCCVVVTLCGGRLHNNSGCVLQEDADDAAEETNTLSLSRVCHRGGIHKQKAPSQQPESNR